MFDSWKNSKVKEVQYGNLQATAVQAPVIERNNVFSTTAFAFKSLWTGLKITMYYFLRPKTIVTQQYPENRETLKMPERYRHNLKLKYNEEGLHNCTGCKICETHCPNASIIIESTKGEISKKIEVDSYVWRQDSCTFCNICVLVCPFDALEWNPDFESTVYDRRLLVTQLNKYAGPPAKVIGKMDDEKKESQLNANKEKYREKYIGPNIPMNGATLAGVSKLGDSMDKKGGGESNV
ncbi:MAG: 4Fe-4S binding protein [Halobacteriovoraceae bacterium]|jgi:formate hydrogenlyase subunit 6/NADH:ubiquinone oxidoreductase subunit I|nr:4Fe-4S binding protein [Halobacteriovoraceae bacterium]